MKANKSESINPNNRFLLINFEQSVFFATNSIDNYIENEMNNKRHPVLHVELSKESAFNFLLPISKNILSQDFDLICAEIEESLSYL